jgi:hypothetical protein
MNHRPHRGHVRTFEALGQHHFPATPNESFESILYSKLPTVRTNKTDEFAIEFCDIIISLWARCLEEKYVSLLVHLYYL